MGNKYNKGSEWRKWDLHVHTPETKLSDNYKTTDKNEDVWEKYCKLIEESDVEVFGITDYFSVENYFKFIEKHKQLYPQSKKVFFPNIEFRIDSKNKDGDHIQIHLVFSNLRKTLNKLNNFLTRLKLVSTDNENLTSKFCESDDLIEVGYNKAMIKVDDIKLQLSENFSKDDYVVVGLARGYGSLRPGRGDSRGGEYAKELDKKCDLFYGSSKDTRFFLNKIEGRGQYNLPPKAIINGSDVHSFDNIKNKLGKSYLKKNEKGQIVDYSEITWIKADPTFDGLKQIIYEPDERVKIQEENPQCEFIKPYFKEINILNDINIFENEELKFKKTKIELNSNLVAIIGGRGEGKSILIDYFANGFNISHNDKYLLSKHFSLVYSKGICHDDNINYNFRLKNNLEFLYISQNMVKDIALDHRELGKEIRKLLNIESVGFSDSTQKDIDIINFNYKTLMKWFDETNENGFKINNKEELERVKKQYEELLNSITNTGNKQKLELYTENIKQIRLFESNFEKIKNIQTKLTEFQDEINKELKELKENISLVSFQIQKDELVSILSKLELEIISKNKKNEEIKNDFSKVYKGDLTSLLTNADKYKSAIEAIKEKLLVIKKEKSKFSNLSKQKKDISEKIKNELERQIGSINTAWSKITKGDSSWSVEQRKLMNKILSDREIDIKGKVFFDKTKFYNGIKEYINGRYFKNKNNIGELEKYFEITDYKSFLEYLSGKIDKHLKDDTDYFRINEYEDDFESYFYDLKNRQNYLYVQPEITFKNKTLDKISVGQRGTVYLCLKLATSAFSVPIIYDQPEDDLDNQFIINELIDIFKQIKKFRQVIIVTHNANLVVNSDAEQVIVAKNIDEVLSYKGGSLENDQLISEVCNILEGGKEAFEQRKKRYKLN